MTTRMIIIAGRALLALLFIYAGVAKIVTPQPFLDHMAAFHVPTFLLPAVIALELGGGLSLLTGWKLKYSASALAVFCVLTAVIFHYDISIRTERTLFLKDLAIAGALMLTAVNMFAARGGALVSSSIESGRA